MGGSPCKKLCTWGLLGLAVRGLGGPTRKVLLSLVVLTGFTLLRKTAGLVTCYKLSKTEAVETNPHCQ